jgi:outer membrane protein assembly factor BamB
MTMINRFAIVIVLALPLAAWAADYPQWRGPDRSGVSKETGLLKEWPKEGPKLLWKNTDVGGGYSTPSVAGGRIYVQGTRDDAEFTLALDEKKGQKIWATELGKVGKNYGPQYPGTRATPTVDSDAVYCLGSDGDLVCLTAADGGVRWRKNLKQDFAGKPGMWAYSESPLVDGDVLVCTPGGSEATLVALNKKDGRVIWKSAVPGGDKAAYASAIVAETGGVKQYIQFLHNGVVGVDAATGRFLWRYDKTKEQAANIPTPVYHDGFVYSAAGRSGGGLVKLTATDGGVTATQVYFSKALNNPIGGMVLVGDYLYGTGAQALECWEFATGKIKWQERSVGKGAVSYADGHLYVRGEEGQAALVEATPDGYREKGRFKQPDHGRMPAWPYPVVANGCLYLRDVGVLLCYDIKDPKAAN